MGVEVAIGHYVEAAEGWAQSSVARETMRGEIRDKDQCLGNKNELFSFVAVIDR